MTVFALGGAAMISASRESAQSATTLTLCVLGLWVLFELARPLDRVRRALVATMIALGVGAFTIPAVADFFVLEIPAPDYAVAITAVSAVGAGLISLALRLVNRYLGEEDPPRASRPLS